MNEGPYQNKFAPLYDFFQKGVENDIQFYLDHFKEFDGSILEIGAGTGRITIPLLKQGLDITPLDLAPGMLACLKEKTTALNFPIGVVRGDMRTFHVNKKFDAIIVTFRTFQHLYNVQDQFLALKNFKRHLKPGGILIFDVYQPSMKYMAHGDWKWRKDSVVKMPGKSEKIKIDYRNRYDMATQMMKQEFRASYSNGQKQIMPFKMRFFFRFEIEHLLKLTGFKVKNVYGDFKKGGLRDGSPEMVWVVTNKSAN
jgi:ubiquinone/menaquinone biosynthesis C-methylase UbiE